MSDAYDLKLYLKEKIDVASIIDFFAKEKFVYSEDVGYGAGGGSDFLRIPLPQAIEKMGGNGGSIWLKDNSIELQLTYAKDHDIFFLGVEYRDLQKLSTKKIVKRFVEFAKKNLPITDMKEYFGHEQEYEYVLGKT